MLGVTHDFRLANLDQLGPDGADAVLQVAATPAQHTPVQSALCATGCFRYTRSHREKTAPTPADSLADLGGKTLGINTCAPAE